MTRFEYKVIPAPKRGEKAPGAKTTPDRFAVALTKVMNDLGRDGWEYLRADTLPCDERVGLTGKQTTFQNMLVFRRALQAVAAVPAGAPAPEVVPRQGIEAPRPAPLVLTAPGNAPPVGAANSNGVAAE